MPGPIQLEVVSPQYEDLGRLRQGEAMEIDFNFNERVRVRDARSGRVLKTHTIQSGGNVRIGDQSPGNTNPGNPLPEIGPDPRQGPGPGPGSTIQGLLGELLGSGNTTTGTSTVGPAINGGPFSGPTTNGVQASGLGPAGDLQTEIRSALATVNAARGRLGKKPFQLHPLLQKAAVRRASFMASQTRVMNDVMHTTGHYFTDPATGQKIGMNKWVRDTGYRLSPLSADTANNVESTFGHGETPSVSLRGFGAKIINQFLGEGPGGGHYEAMMQDDDHFAFAAALAANDTAIVACVLVSSEVGSPGPINQNDLNVSPLAGNPGASPLAGSASTGNTGTAPADLTGNSVTGTTIPSFPGSQSQVSFIIENKSNSMASVNYRLRGTKKIARLSPTMKMTITVDEKSLIEYQTTTNRGALAALRSNPKLVIADGPATSSTTQKSAKPVTTSTPGGNTNAGVEPGIGDRPSNAQPSGKPVVMNRVLDRRGYYNNDNGRYYNYIQRKWNAGQTYRVSVRSTDFAPVVLIRKGVRDNHAIAANLTEPSTATLQFTPTKSDTYSINVTSQQQLKVGAYKLTIEGE